MTPGKGYGKPEGEYNKHSELAFKFFFELASDVKVTAFDSLMPAVLAELERSYVLVDRVYELEELLPNAASPDVSAFGLARARVATEFTASLYLTVCLGSV